MKAIKYSFLLIYVLANLYGCASTNMTSFTDPDFQSIKFKRILVVANVADLQWRQTIESRMVEAFRPVDVEAFESLRLFPPTRNFTNEEKIDLLNRYKIDGYITINVGESGVQSVYVPPTGSTTKTKGEVTVTGNRAQYEGKSTTTNYGGYTLNKPWAQFQTKLFDVSSGSTAWVASSYTGGNAYANLNTVINSYCDKVVDKLKEDGLVIRIKK